ncbi:MAG: TA system VapC family ribonuclease toxin [Terrimicrobiaceae bacterium]
MFLLDVNVLIALADPSHVHHQAVSSWFSRHQRDGWATCPLTENGVLRIIGHPNYPKGPGSPEATRPLLELLLAQPGHQFWADTISLVSSRRYPGLPAAKHLTDFYLLALAIEHGARLATIDRLIDPRLIPGGPAAYFLIPSVDEGASSRYPSP